MEDYRAQVMQVAQEHHWTVHEDTPPGDRDARLTTRQGIASCPVFFYHTGKIVVQGKASPLRDTLIEMARQLESGERVSNDPAGGTTGSRSCGDLSTSSVPVASFSLVLDQLFTNAQGTREADFIYTSANS